MPLGRALIYSFSFSHHGRHSSYHHLLDFLPECHKIDATLRVPSWLPRRIRDAISYRWLRANEWRLRSFFSKKERGVAHFLYPENSLFRTPEWKRSHALVLSCHQPAEFLHEIRGTSHPFLRGLKSADALVLLSHNAVEEYRALAPSAKIVILPHGVDTDFWAPDEKEPQSTRKPLVVTVGNWLRDYKGWAQVVASMQHVSTDVEFAVVANHDTIAQAKSFLGEHNPRVQFYTGLSDLALRDLYRRADAAFVPLFKAEANNAVLEALSMGLPLVATDLPAVREYAGDAALYIDQRSPTDCSESLAELLNNSDRQKVLSQLARTRAVEQLSWPKIAIKLQTLYSELIGGDIKPECP